MIIKRDLYLDKLIRSMHNGMIKVITGIRRCGKSYLIDEYIQVSKERFHLFKYN